MRVSNSNKNINEAIKIEKKYRTPGWVKCSKVNSQVIVMLLVKSCKLFFLSIVNKRNFLFLFLFCLYIEAVT